MRVMRIAVLVLVTLALTSCAEAEREAPSLECEVADRDLTACLMDRSAGPLQVDCMALVPFDQPERISGTWVFDFEVNQFFENQTEVPQDWWRSDGAMTYLIIEGSSLDDLVSGTRDRYAVDVSFDGRRELCDLDHSPDSTIMVDRVVSLRVIEQEPSEWYRGN